MAAFQGMAAFTVHLFLSAYVAAFHISSPASREYEVFQDPVAD
jgi:hypothetical protein